MIAKEPYLIYVVEDDEMLADEMGLRSTQSANVR